MAAPRDTYLLKIEGVRPFEMPLSKFIEYVRAAEMMLGAGDALHLVAVEDASTGAAILIDEGARELAERHVASAPLGMGPKTVVRGYRRLERLAHNDNRAVSLVRPDGTQMVAIAPTPIRDEVIGPVRQEGSLQGHVVGVVGADDTKHVRLQDGETLYTGIEADERLAADLGKHLFLPVVRLIGTGWWSRKGEAGWSLERFKATNFEVLDDRSLLEVIHDLRAVAASQWSKTADPWSDLGSLREDG